MAGFGNSKPSSNLAGPGWGLGGLIVGLGLGLGGPKVLHKFSPHDTATKKTKPVTTKPKTAAGSGLDIAAVPAQRGLLLSSNVPVKLLRPSESKRSQQQSDSVFTGFKNWLGTAAYLKNGQGGLFIKATAGSPVNTGWKEADYDKLVRGVPLHADIASGQSYTLYFQRKGQRPIDLGTFIIGNAAPVAAKPVAAKPPAATPKPH